RRWRVLSGLRFAPVFAILPDGGASAPYPAYKIQCVYWFCRPDKRSAIRRNG
ncbi:hypothetical protein HMPREF3207_02668, partial [Citrobacter koseri]